MHKKTLSLSSEVFVSLGLVGSQVLIVKQAVTLFDLWIDVNSRALFVKAVAPWALLAAYQLTPLCPPRSHSAAGHTTWMDFLI